MSVLTIRKYERFAMRQKVAFAGGRVVNGDGLLIEISLAGCRISNLSSEDFAFGETLQVDVPGFGALDGQVRWSNPGVIGVGFERPLFSSQLISLLKACRDQTDESAAARRYAS